MMSSRSQTDKPGRFVTRLPDVTNRRESVSVQIDPRLGEPNGPWEKKYRWYIGMMAKMKASIAIAWDDIAEVKKSVLL